MDSKPVSSDLKASQGGSAKLNHETKNPDRTMGKRKPLKSWNDPFEC